MQIYQNFTLLNNFKNKNLYLNSDFRINQRGITSLICDGKKQFFVDRWWYYCNYSGSKCCLENSHLILYSGRIGQSIECIKGVYTLCIKTLFSNITLAIYKGNDKYVSFIPPSENGGLYYIKVELEDNENIFMQTISFEYKEDIKIIFEYIKLEAGIERLPFVRPDYSIELLKCQKYYVKENVYYIRSAENSTTLIPMFHRTIPMRIIPTIKIRSLSGSEDKLSDINKNDITNDKIITVYNNSNYQYPKLELENTLNDTVRIVVIESDAEIY